MKSFILIILGCFLLSGKVLKAQTVYTSTGAKISFFSEAPLEDITAESSQAVSAIDIASGQVYFKVKIRSFQFRKSLMQQHFNENYMESDQYPEAEFKGKIRDEIDLSKNGRYTVTVLGNLNIHNVTRSYTTQATLDVSDGRISAKAVFPVRVADHDIKVPRLVIRNIAEVVEVTISANYTPRDPES